MRRLLFVLAAIVSCGQPTAGAPSPAPAHVGAGAPVPMVGDVTGTSAASVVSTVHGISISDSGAIGNVLQLTDAGVSSWAAVNLEGGAAFVVGVLPVPNGGTGAITETAHGVLLGEGTAPFGATAYTTDSGIPLVSVAGADPTFGAVDLSGPGVTNVLPTANESPVAPTGTAGGALTGTYPNPGINLEAGASVGGILPVTSGGTGAATESAHGVVVGEGTGPFIAVAYTTDSGIPLVSTVGGNPTFGAVDLSGPGVTNVLPAGKESPEACGGDMSGSAGACVVAAISGSTPILITPNVVEWTKGATTPTISQASPTTDVATVSSYIVPQQPYASASSNLGGGSENVVLAVPVSGTSAEAYSCVVRGTVASNFPLACIGKYPGGVNAAGLWLNGTTTGTNAPTTSNYNLLNNAGNLLINGASQVSFSSNGSTRLTVSQTQILTTLPVGGAANSTFNWYTTTGAVACGTGGTVTLSSAQAQTPGLNVTTGTLTSNCTLDFSTNASTGWYVIDLAGVGALGSFNLIFKNGTNVPQISASALTSLRATGKTGVAVWAYGTNLITIL